MNRLPREIALCVLPAMTTTIGAACISTKAPERTGLLTDSQHVTVTARQLIMRIDEFTELRLGVRVN